VGQQIALVKRTSDHYDSGYGCSHRMLSPLVDTVISNDGVLVLSVPDRRVELADRHSRGGADGVAATR